MIVDTSALVALIRSEPSRAAVRNALLEARHAQADILMSAAGYIELGVVIDGERDPVRSRRVDELLAELAVELVPVDTEQARVARQAYRDFGRGSGHPARLTFGDCFSYALAAVRREPLLFVGDRFGHTDLVSALP